MTYTKEDMEEAYVKGYLDGYGVEEPAEINKRTAERLFSQWFAVNFDD